MPLMAHPDNPNTLLLAQSGKLAGDPDCCCNDGGCCELIKTCANVVGTVANRTGILHVSGIVNTAQCTLCMNANGSFMHSTGSYFDVTSPFPQGIDRVCGVNYNLGTPTNTFDFCTIPGQQGAIGWWAFGFRCEQDGSFPGGLRVIFSASLFQKPAPVGTENQWATYFRIGDINDLISLCAATPVTLSIESPNQAESFCSMPSTIQMQLA